MNKSLITLERLAETFNLNPELCDLVVTQPHSTAGLAAIHLVGQLLACETTEEIFEVTEAWKTQVQTGKELIGFSEQDREVLSTVFGGR